MEDSRVVRLESGLDRLEKSQIGVYEKLSDVALQLQGVAAEMHLRNKQHDGLVSKIERNSSDIRTIQIKLATSDGKNEIGDMFKKSIIAAISIVIVGACLALFEVYGNV